MPLKRARLRISDYNKKRKARVSSQERRIRMVSLSLTSMVDMFAILVIFLLVNSSTVSQWLEVEHGIQLPKTKFSDPPPKAATLQISTEEIYGDKTRLVTMAQVARLPAPIGALKAWLSKQEKKNGYINVVAHEKIPFGLMRKIIDTCRDSGFQNVNLAVQPRK